MGIKNKLAINRTNLAVDRTILAYLRTMLTMIVVAVSFIKLFNSLFINFIGWLLILISILLFIYGYSKSSKLKNNVEEI